MIDEQPVIDEPPVIDEQPVIDERPVTEQLRQEQLDETAEAVPVPGNQSTENEEEIVTTVETKKQPRKRLSLKLRRPTNNTANLQGTPSPTSTTLETGPRRVDADNNDASETTDAANVLLQLAAGMPTTVIEDTPDTTSPENGRWLYKDLSFHLLHRRRMKLCPKTPQ